MTAAMMRQAHLLSDGTIVRLPGDSIRYTLRVSADRYQLVAADGTATDIPPIRALIPVGE